MACRIVPRASKDRHVNDMHAELNLLKRDTRRDVHLSFLCHRNIYVEDYSSLGKYFRPVANRGRRVTRYENDMNMSVPSIKSSKGHCSIECRGPTHWNKLPNDVKCIEKFEEFKKCISKRTAGTFDNHLTYCEVKCGNYGGQLHS